MVDRLTNLPEDPAARAQAKELLAELARLREANPLLGFIPHPKQAEFLAASTPVQAAFCGNRFGKTAVLVVKALCQLLPDEFIPDHLHRFKSKQAPCEGRIVEPSIEYIYGVLLPELRKWTPKAALAGGGFDTAWDKTRRRLEFACGSWLQMMTYDQDPDKFGGAALDFVGYDEPPTKDIRDECRMRLLSRGGFEMFTLTPLDVTGAGLGWLIKDVWKRRAHPAITVVQGDTDDNPHLPHGEINRYFADMSDEEVRVRRHGEFYPAGGLVYPGGFERRLIDPPHPDSLKNMDIIVGIDPGLRNAGFVWLAFDSDNVAFVFDEALVQRGTPPDYANAINAGNQRWGVDPIYVVDPSARGGSLTTGEAVLQALQRQGIYPLLGQSDIEAGVGEVRRRLQGDGLYISKECTGLRDEAESYMNQKNEDGKVRPVKENDHRLDACRYALMTRTWTPTETQEAAKLGWQPGFAPDSSELTRQIETDDYPLGLV